MSSDIVLLKAMRDSQVTIVTPAQNLCWCHTWNLAGHISERASPPTGSSQVLMVCARLILSSIIRSLMREALLRTNLALINSNQKPGSLKMFWQGVGTEIKDLGCKTSIRQQFHIPQNGPLPVFHYISLCPPPQLHYDLPPPQPHIL